MSVLNDVPEVQLEIHGSADCRLEFDWWADETETTPINISEVRGAISGGGESHSLTPFATVTGNVGVINIPRATHSAWTSFQQGEWELVLRSAEGEDRPICRGPVRYYPEL